MERFKKIFIVSMMFVTVLSMSIIVAPEVGATASAGDLIKMSGLSSVYYLAADGKRYVFPNEQTYFSWYSDFSGVVTISQSELESYPLGANVTVRPGTKLVKITTNPKVYAVTAGGNLLAIPDEATAATLYGAEWNKRIIDVSDAFFTNYKISTGTAVATAYPAGSLVKFGTSGDVFYINADGTASKISNEAAFTANRFKWADVITATIAAPTAGADIVGVVATLIDTSSGAGGTANAGTGLTVALASDSPASATVITNTSANGQANVPFIKVNFTAAADGDVKVTNLKFKRTGISADADLDGLFLYDGATRLTDASSISSNYVTFNNASGLFTVAQGTTKSITLKGDMSYAANSGKTIGFNVVAATDVTTNGAAVSGSFPMSGNLMSTANTTDLGQVAFSGYTTYPSGAATDISPALDQEVFRFIMTSTNQELSVERLRLTAVGSIQSTDLRNFKMTVAGSQVGPTVASMTSDNVVDFDMSAAPLVIPKNTPKTISLRADIVGGSTRTFYMSFQNQQDIIVKDTSYNVYIEPYTSGTFSVIRPGTATPAVGSYTITAGSLSISRATNSPNTDVAVDATNQTLAIFDFTATGEDIKVQNLNASTTVGTTNSGILNAKIYVDDVQVGTTKNLTAASAVVNFTFGSTFIVKAGTTAKVKVVGDIKKAAGTSYSGGETVVVAIAAGSSNTQSMTSLNTGSYPAADTVGYTLNITAGALTVTKYSGYGNQTVVAGTNDAKLGSFVVSAGAAEGVAVSSISVDLDATEYSSSTLTRMYLVDHATGAMLGTAKSSLSASNSYSVSFNLAASQGKIIDLYGDIKSGANAGTWRAQIGADGSGITTSKAVTIASADTTSQTITIGAGTLTATNGSMPDAAIVLAGSAGNYMAQYTFSAANEGFTVDKLQLKVPNGFATSTAGVTVKYTDKAGAAKESTQIFTSSAALANSTATFTGLSIYVPANGDASINVYVDMTSLSSNGASGAVGAVSLDWDNGFNATGDSGTAKTTIGSADLTGNSFYNRKSKPTFAKLDAGTDPVNGALYKFSVAADNAGNIEIKQLSFTVSTTACDVTDLYLYDPSSSTTLTDATKPITAIQGAAVAVLVGGIENDVLTVGTTAKTYELRGAVTGYGTAGDGITVGFKQDTAYVANGTAYAKGADGVDAGADTKYNVWSDRSASAHTTATSDWTNGYLLKDMTVSQNFSK